jgi:superfamily II helicase
MTQELIDLRNSILEGRYEDALQIVDELEGMSKQAILRNIESFLTRMLVHLIKNQIEKRLTNSWVASICDSIRQIQKLNLKDNKKSYYIQADEWQTFLEDALGDAIRPASVEVLEGKLTPSQLSRMIDREQILQVSKKLLALTYYHKPSELLDRLDAYLTQLPGGEAWQSGQE